MGVRDRAEFFPSPLSVFQLELELAFRLTFYHLHQLLCLLDFCNQFIHATFTLVQI
jgi:hypothetical protein